MRGRHPLIVRGVKPRLTTRRNSVCPGGSMATRFPPAASRGRRSSPTPVGWPSSTPRMASELNNAASFNAHHTSS